MLQTVTLSRHVDAPMPNRADIISGGHNVLGEFGALARGKGRPRAAKPQKAKQRPVAIRQNIPTVAMATKAAHALRAGQAGGEGEPVAVLRGVPSVDAIG